MIPTSLTGATRLRILDPITRLFIHVALAVLLAELAIGWLAPAMLRALARIPLAATRTFRLPPRATAIDDASYRDAAVRIDDALPAIPPRLSVGRHVLVAHDRSTFVLRGAAYNPRYLARIHAERAGDEVTLRAWVAPLPITSPLVVLAVLVDRLAAGSPNEMITGALIGGLIGSCLAWGRARTACEEALDSAMSLLEQEMLEAASKPTSAERAAPLPGRDRWRALAAVALACSAIAGAYVFGRPSPRTLPPQFGLEGAPAARLVAIMEEEMAPFMNHPELRRRAQEPAASGEPADPFVRGRAFGEEVVARGFPRLPASDLREWNRLRLALATSSDSVCSGFWSGGLDMAAMAGALSQLGDDDLRSWMRISARAGVLELESTSPVVHDELATDEGLDAIGAALSESDRAVYYATLEAGADADDASGCRTLLWMLRGAESMPEAEQERFLRALASF